ncbi:MAG TPA: S8 family serine peptidase [Cyclobacteriaceae bacterium]|nr:S8 family serine peptidase [Cyclobacteriaceae bacterium]
MLRSIIFSILIVFICVYSFGQSLGRSDNNKEASHHPEGDISFIDFSINNITLLKSKFPTLRGNGVTICLKENSPDFNDLDITKHLKLSPLKSSTVTNHATSLATILVGDGVTSPQSEGISSEAKLVCVDFQNLMPESNDFYREQNISIINHSYGTVIENFYGSNAHAYDDNIESMPQLLHVFSAGNLGYASGTGTYSGIAENANLTGNFKQSKNSLAIGSVDSEGTPRPWSSSGPAYDGRLKPEVCAFSDEGTSGSAAIVSGVAALLQEYYLRQNNNYPDAALLKAVLINSTTDVGKKGIDWQTGYGNINAYKALKTLEYNHIIRGVLNEDEDVTIPLSVPVNSRNLKVTLTWTDPTAHVNSSIALVNDLDLEIIGASRWLPWILNSYPAVDSLQKQAIRGHDHLNTTEQITIENPDEESYSIHVSASKIKQQQTFHIAYQWDSPDEFSWTSPVATDKLMSSRNVILRWESTLKASKGNLEISTDNEQSWSVAQTDVPLSPGMLSWFCPNIFSKAKFRMIVDDQAYASDEFIISPITTLSMTYHCSDSLQLQWNTESASDSIKTFKLQHYNDSNGSWENSVQEASGNATFHNTNETDVFAVLPVMPNGREGIRSESMIVKDQNIFCFYKNVAATIVNDSIQIQCELSTTENVNSITFQTKNNGTLTNLKTNTVIAGESYYTIYDRNPIEGDNIYRVQIILTDGKIIFSDFIVEAYLKEKNFAVYPNPADSHTYITILSKSTEAFTVKLFDYSGHIVLEQEFYDQRIDLSVINLKSGIYIYKIYSGTHQPSTGKIVLK